jgi:glycosyl transferase family 25
VRIYLINLDRRQDRLFRISRKLVECGLDFTRIPAVDAKSLPESQSNGVLPKTYTANWLSHQKALEAVANSTDDFGIILEDDADLKSSWIGPELLHDLAAFMRRSEIDVLQIGYISQIYRLPSLRGILELIQDLRGGRFSFDNTLRLWIVKRSYRAGSHCYLVSKRSATRLLGLNLPAALATDPFFTAMAESGLGLQVARLAKSLVEQESRHGNQSLSDSDLEFK